MDLRTRLGPLPPHDFSLKSGWKAAIQATRERRRRTGQAGRLTGRAEVERACSLPLRAGVVDSDLSALKLRLRSVLREDEGSEERDAALGALESGLDAILYAIHTGELSLELQGWPEMLGSADLTRLLGRDPQSLRGISALAAAELVHRLDGQVIGGRTLELRPVLPPQTVLPALPRGRRDRSPRRRGEPWLEVTDDESRFSLTPEPVARAQAALFQGTEVIDVFGGVGGHTVALAESGRQVWMIEPDPERIAAARRSLGARGLGHRVELVCGSLQTELSRLMHEHPEAGLLLDPPWGGRDWDRKGTDWVALMGGFSGLEAACRTAREVVAKLPRSFELNELAERGRGWRARLEWGADTDLPKMLTAWRGPGSAG